jgi:adenosylmethionine-8-amino-7-oxononanoate aminotransferase
MSQDLTKHLWLPYSQMKTALPPQEAVRTSGSSIQLVDGRELIDGIASWWTACHGYNHPYILAAMQQQLERMPHVMFGGLTHEPAVRLAARLAALAPGDIERVFFVDSGSVAVEVALKMSIQYWLNRGENGRTQFLHFRDGYHGDTMACMAICDPDESMHSHFKGWLPQHPCLDLPCDDKSFVELDAFLRQHHATLAAVIIEPLVQGAGGMKFHDAACLKRVADLCIQHGVLLIVDEIFTGFGRTGTMFACEQAGVVPDILCIGKGLTAGTISLAATLARRHVFEAFWSDDLKAALMHGPTYMANPLACAAANASLDLFECEPRLQEVAALEAAMCDGLEDCRSLPNVVDVRVKGAIGVVELIKIKDPVALRQAFIDRGVWIRPIGNVIYLTPAFTIGKAELESLMTAIYEVLRQSN